MKPSWMMLALCLLALAIPARAQESTEAELNRLEDLRYEAMTNVNPQVLDEILADEFVYQTLQGVTHTKASYIRSVTSGEAKINSFRRENSRVKFYGDDVATVMATTHLDIAFKGVPRKIDLFYLNVWVKRDGRWQLVARQSTALPNKQ